MEEEDLFDNDNESVDSEDSEASSVVDERRRLAAAFVVGLLPLIFIHADPIPMNNSVHTARARLQELMNQENPKPFRDAFRMNKPTLMALSALLRTKAGMEDKRETTVEEYLLLFIRHGLMGESNRTAQRNNQRSADTIHKAVNEVADYILSIQDEFIRPPLHTDEPRPEIAGNPKFSPFFDDVDGAVDGTYCAAFVEDSEASKWRNRKGKISQNVLVYAGFNLQAYYVLAGWEGSAHDARVFEDALTKGFPLAGRKFGDAAYSLTRMMIKPYRGVRYNLKEFGPAELRPQTREELFNLRHAMKRNCVERCFGVTKKRFPALSNMNEFPIALQVKLVLCAFCLNNWIRRHASFEDDAFDNLSEEEMAELAQEYLEDEEAAYAVEAAAADNIDNDLGVESGAQWRDRVAQAMWVQYQEELARRGLI
jgi:DDE superfamily endonuclease